MRYFSCIQCKNREGVTGDFIRDENKNEYSPTFEGYGDLARWMRLNGWAAVGGLTLEVKRAEGARSKAEGDAVCSAVSVEPYYALLRKPRHVVARDAFGEIVRSTIDCAQ